MPDARFARLRGFATAVLGYPAVVAGLRVFERYNSGGGGLLAGGLAYAALFAIVPGLILLAGVTGLVFADSAERAKAVAVIVGVVPPLGSLIETILGESARAAGQVSLLGGLVLVWGTSRFVVAFQDALARVMGGGRRRGLLVTNLAALGVVILMIGAIVLSTLASGLLAFLDAGENSGVLGVLSGVVEFGLGLMPIAAIVVATVLVYRIVPIQTPPWRAAIVPGLVAGLVIALLAQLFVYVAPRLIGAAAFIGSLATVFAALAWLALSFQALLLGAAWVRDMASQQTPRGARTDLS
jgi:membrane protein